MRAEFETSYEQDTKTFTPLTVTFPENSLCLFSCICDSSIFFLYKTFVQIFAIPFEQRERPKDLFFKLRSKAVLNQQLCHIKPNVSHGCVIYRAPQHEKSKFNAPFFCTGIEVPDSDKAINAIGLFGVDTTIDETSYPVICDNMTTSNPVQLHCFRDCYVLKKSIQLDENTVLLGLAALPSNSDSNISESMIVMSMVTDPLESIALLSLRIVSLAGLEQISTPVSFPLPPDYSSQRELKISVTTADESNMSFIMLWCSNRTASMNVFIGFTAYFVSQNRLLPLGWYEFQPPTLDSALVSLQPITCKKTDTDFYLAPSIALVWERSACEFYVLNYNATTNDLHIKSFREIQFHSQKKHLKNSQCFFCVPFKQHLALYGFYDERQGCLNTSINHLLHGVSFAVAPNGELTPHPIHLECSSVPKKILALVLSDSTLVLCVVFKKQMNLYWLWGLDKCVIPNILDINITTETSFYALPNENILNTLGIPNSGPLKQAYNLVMNDSMAFTNEIKTSKPELEAAINCLIDLGLLTLTWPVVKRLLNLQFEESCRYGLRSTLVSETVLVAFLQQQPCRFLSDIVTYFNVSRDVFIYEIQKHLQTAQLERILKYLTGWCKIHTSLPEALIEKGKFPPLEQVLHFTSILIDAKFQELTTIPNVSIMENMKEMTLCLSDCLVVKKAVQKFLGQLHALNYGKSNIQDVEKIQQSQDLIQRISISI